MNIRNAIIVLDNGRSIVYSNISPEMLLEKLMDALLPSSEGKVVATVENPTVPEVIVTPAPRKRGRPKGSKNSSPAKESQVVKRKEPHEHDVCIPVGECIGTLEYYFRYRGFTPVAIWKYGNNGRPHVLFLSEDGEWAYGDRLGRNPEGGFYADPEKIKPGSLQLA